MSPFDEPEGQPKLAIKSYDRVQAQFYPKEFQLRVKVGREAKISAHSAAIRTRLCCVIRSFGTSARNLTA